MYEKSVLLENPSDDLNLHGFGDFPAMGWVMAPWHLVNPKIAGIYGYE